MKGRGGRARIGNRRAKCTTCNNFAQNVLRLARKRLAEKFPSEYVAIRQAVEGDLYPQVIEQWTDLHPRSRPRPNLQSEEDIT